MNVSLKSIGMGGLMAFLLSSCNFDNNSKNGLPSVDAGNNVEVKVNSSVELRGDGKDFDGSIVSYEWREGETVLSTSSSLVYLPTKEGQRVLTFTVMDNDGNVNSDTLIVTVLSELNSEPIRDNNQPVSTSNTDNIKKLKPFHKGISTGDSFTVAGWHYPQLLPQLSSYEIVNHGYSGRMLTKTISENWGELLSSQEAQGADFFCIEGGTNDINGDQSLEAMKKAWLRMVEEAKDKGLLNGMAINISPWIRHTLHPDRLKKVQEWNRWLKNETTKRGYLYIDIHRLLEDPNVPNRMNPSYINGSYHDRYEYEGVYDAIHPNQEGQRKITALIKNSIDEENKRRGY